MTTVVGKKYHIFHLSSARGVSALCYSKPRPIPVEKGLETWTFRQNWLKVEPAQRCKSCDAIYKRQESEKE